AVFPLAFRNKASFRQKQGVIPPNPPIFLYAWPYFGFSHQAQVPYGEGDRTIPAGLARGATVAAVWHWLRGLLHCAVDTGAVVVVTAPPGHLVHPLRSGRRVRYSFRRLATRDRHHDRWRPARPDREFRRGTHRSCEDG